MRQTIRLCAFTQLLNGVYQQDLVLEQLEAIASRQLAIVLCLCLGIGVNCS